MNNPPLFELLRLPFLAYQHVLRTSNVREQYKMATLSKRMKFIVRSTHSRQCVYATARFGTLATFHLWNKEMKNQYKFVLPPVIPNVYPTVDSIKQQIIFIKEVFNLQSFSGDFLYRYPVGLEFTFIYFLKKENLKLQNITFYNKLKGIYVHVLRECSDAVSIELWRADRVTIDHLIKHSMNCERVELRWREYTAEELNKFFKRWVEGSKIEVLSCRIEDPSRFPLVFDGLDVRPVLKAVSTSLNEIKTFEPGKCFLVKQTSGPEAIVYLDPDDYLTLNAYFSLDLTINNAAREWQLVETDQDEEISEDDWCYREPLSESDDFRDDLNEEVNSEHSTVDGDDEDDIDTSGYSMKDDSGGLLDSKYGVEGDRSSDEKGESSSDGSTGTEDGVPYANFDNPDSDADYQEDTSEHSTDEGDQEDSLMEGNSEDSINTRYGVANGDNSSEGEEQDSDDGSIDTEYGVPYGYLDSDREGDADDEGSETEGN